MCTVRVRTSLMNRTEILRSVIVSRVNKSVASTPVATSAQEAPPSGVGPAWCWAESSGGQDPPNRAGAYAVSETDEFAVDPAVAPGRVLPCQAQHQGPDLVINRCAA
jgi:hypothetical protein